MLTDLEQSAAEVLREKIYQRMQQVTQCVTSDGFLNGLQEAIANPETAQYVLSASNLRALGAPIPSGTTMDAVNGTIPPGGVGYVAAELTVSSVGVVYQLRQPSGPTVQSRDDLRSAILLFMHIVTNFYHDEGFNRALQIVLGDIQRESDPNQFIQAIFSRANLQALGAVLPTDGVIVGESRDLGPMGVQFQWFTITVTFLYPD